MRRPEEVICGWEGFREPAREIRTGDILAEGESSQAYVHSNFYILHLEAGALESHPQESPPRCEVLLPISPPFRYNKSTNGRENPFLEAGYVKIRNG